MFLNPTDINSVTKYPFYSDLLNKIYDLRDKYSVMPKISGKSILGRGIFTIPIGNPDGAVMIIGGVQGNHWLTSIMLLLFCEELLATYENGGKLMGMSIKKILESRGVIILPCLNPDSFEITSRNLNDGRQTVEDIISKESPLSICNANGVDISKNFETNWISGKSNKNLGEIYSGKAPFSEPESLCVARLCFDYNVKQLITLGLGKKEIAYGYRDYAPPESKLMAEMIASGSDYKVCKNYDKHCFNNWFVKNFRRPSFSINIDENTAISEEKDIINLYSGLRELLIIAMLL
jgi:g-D-glutamyl-meso-diaminopimelate peptidase